MTLIANNLFQLQGHNPYLSTLGNMGDISNLYQFGWYDWVYFRQKTAAVTYGTVHAHAWQKNAQDPFQRVDASADASG